MHLPTYADRLKKYALLTVCSQEEKHEELERGGGQGTSEAPRKDELKMPERKL
jgi:hypothetical protein